jgi:hypothetical protein
LGGEREKEKFGRVFTGAHTTISFDILYSMIEKPLDPQRYFVEDTVACKTQPGQIFTHERCGI